VRCKSGAPTQAQTSLFARKIAAELRRAGWRLERVLSDNGNEFGKPDFTATFAELSVAHSRITSGRPQTNGHVERLHRTLLEECWRPAFARFLQVRYRGLQREPRTSVDFYNFERAHTGRTTQGRVPADLVYGAHKMRPR
jgi:transposase InsO family protein